MAVRMNHRKLLSGEKMTIESVEQLEDMLSEPSQGVIETLRQVQGDIIVLGAGGKMGPTLARMARRAADEAASARRVIAVSRFSRAGQKAKLESAGAETIVCDLLDPDQIAGLPDAANVVYMVGMKFGTAGQEALTWAMNACLPGLVCRRYRGSRIVAFSTGNVYGLTPVVLGGSVETDHPEPEGEYAMSALGRERVFEHFSASTGTPVALIRLNYAVEVRYGVLVDVARRVWAGEAVDLQMGCVNAIWQGDASAMTLQALAHASSPPFIVNVAGPETLSVRRVAEHFASLMGKPTKFLGQECADAFLSNAQLAHRLFGYPRVTAEQMLEWIAQWVMAGGESLGKPTHFESRDGRY